jgi:hypothetical protein
MMQDGETIRTDPDQDPAGLKGMDRMLPMGVMATEMEIPARDPPKAAQDLTIPAQELAA